MTEQHSEHPVEQKPRTRQSPIVPRASIATTALLAVIAIMSFLATLTLGAVTLVSDTARGWQLDIAREITVQVQPVEGVDIRKSLLDARRITGSTRGVTAVRMLDVEATGKLLEPWLGDDLQLEELPVPRLLAISIDETDPPDIDALRARLKLEVAGASLDDHRAWVDRLTTMARTMIFSGILIFLLVGAATLLIVMFATRGAMAGNREVIEVLHFVGADQSYIASQFQTHFLWLGFRGALIGGLAAMFVFFLTSYWTSTHPEDPSAEQVGALFGTFSVGFTGYIGATILIIVIAALTALSSRLTVLRHVGNMERSQSNR